MKLQVSIIVNLTLLAACAVLIHLCINLHFKLQQQQSKAAPSSILPSGGYDTVLKKGTDTTIYAQKDSYSTYKRYYDSAYSYWCLNQEYRRLRDEQEILYLRTGDDRYRIQGNKYDRLKVKYGKLGGIYYHIYVDELRKISTTIFPAQLNFEQ